MKWTFTRQAGLPRECTVSITASGHGRASQHRGGAGWRAEGGVVSAAITANDRLSLTLFLSLSIHALVLLGVGFTGLAERASRPAPMIEVTLAHEPQDTAPEAHDFLAQADQDGGGDAEDAQIPDRPQESIMPGVPEGQQAIDSAPAASERPSPPERREVAGADDPEPAPEQPAPEPSEERPSAAQLLDTSTAVAASAEFTDPAESVNARYPTKQRLNASTKSHAAAAYMREWVRKVEQVGNLNYPDEARRRELTGRLIVEVTIRPDGHVRDIRILRASPHPLLDQAAERIVEMAGPYSRVPDEVLEGNDLLVITRTWEFDKRRQLSTQ